MYASTTLPSPSCSCTCHQINSEEVYHHAERNCSTNTLFPAESGSVQPLKNLTSSKLNPQIHDKSKPLLHGISSASVPPRGCSLPKITAPFLATDSDVNVLL